MGACIHHGNAFGAVGEITQLQTDLPDFRATGMGPAPVARDALLPLPGPVAACGVSRGSSLHLARPPSGCWETAQPLRRESFCVGVAVGRCCGSGRREPW